MSRSIAIIARLMMSAAVPWIGELSAARSALSRSTRLDDVKSGKGRRRRSEEHTSELQSLMRISYAVFCLKKKKKKQLKQQQIPQTTMFSIVNTATQIDI